MNIIEALKKNERPFSLMPKDMQDKAKDIGAVHFLRLEQLNGRNEAGWVRWDKRLWCDNWVLTTFKLRHDYEEKPEIVECEVYEASYGVISYGDKKSPTDLHQACSHKNFAGFKYENDQDYIRPFARMYRLKNSLGSDAVTRIYAKNIDKYEVLTPTHVIIKKGN